MSVPVNERPEGWDEPITGGGINWDSPYAKIGHNPHTGEPYRFPVCSLCGECCGHVNPPLITCSEVRRLKKVAEEYGEAECLKCRNRFKVRWKLMGFCCECGGEILYCPRCGYDFPGEDEPCECWKEHEPEFLLSIYRTSG